MLRQWLRNSSYWEKIGLAKEDKDNLDSQISSLTAQLDTERIFNIEQEIRLDYLENRQFTNSFIFSELFINKDQYGLVETNPYGLWIPVIGTAIVLLFLIPYNYYIETMFKKKWYYYVFKRWCLQWK